MASFEDRPIWWRGEPGRKGSQLALAPVSGQRGTNPHLQQQAQNQLQQTGWRGAVGFIGEGILDTITLAVEDLFYLIAELSAPFLSFIFTAVGFFVTAFVFALAIVGFGKSFGMFTWL